MKSAPARRMLVSSSSMARDSSIMPAAAAALSIAYSPLTLYAPSGRGDDWRTRAMMSRYDIAGLTISMSAPSSSSRRASRRASR